MDVSINSSVMATMSGSADARPVSSSKTADDAPKTTSQAVDAARSEPTPKEVLQAVDNVRQAVEAKAPNELSFSIDSDSGRSLVRITDQKTGALIRQIPSAEMLEIANAIDKMQGQLLNQKA